MSTARREARPVKGFQVRLHNRRVYGGLMADGSILWRFKRLTPEGTVYGERIRLSREAVMAMFSIMAQLDTPNMQISNKK
jgi:hypothetical protein